MPLARPHILLPILDEHFIELDTLWERREICVFDPVWAAGDLAELERRANRHLAGLLVGQGHAVDLARGALLADERGAATAGAFVLLDLDVSELREELIQALTAAEPEAAHGIRIALRHRELGTLEPRLRALAAMDSPLQKTCACDVLAFHRCAPVEGLRRLLADSDEAVRTLAISSIGRWRADWQEADLRQQLEDPAAALAQRAALETSARLALPGLLPICLEAAFRPDNPSGEALKFLGVIGGEEEIPRLVQALANPALASSALQALGALGRPQVVPTIIEALGSPLLAHDAAAAFLRITAAEDVTGEPVAAPGDLSAEEAEFWDEHVEADPILAGRWWQQNAERLTAAEQWQTGCAVTGWPVAAELTLEARRDVFLRTCFRRPGSLAELELEASFPPALHSGAINGR